MTGNADLLSVSDLSLEFRTRAGAVHALDHVNFSISEGEIVGVVGESGSGKSVMAYAMMGLLDRAGRITSGEVNYRGTPISRLREPALRRLRGAEISMVFQSPRSALNPIRTVGLQLTDVIREHRGIGKRAAREKAVEMLAMVKI
ncbi:MAG: ATP-binding cassette domain-containing protein, partial [bacterium]